jgi:lipopolysaccharide transport system ATP-binding protein
MINITPEKITEPSPDRSEVVLSVEGVSKKFCRDLKRSLFYGVQDIAGELTGTRQESDRLRDKEFWALDNVSFELKKGEALGLVGKNGSGKSTLLRIIAGLIKPDRGTVRVRGRVAPLIALGAGFNPILTGRENIYANMSILGLSTKEIDERFDDVVEFAEIGDAIDSPVQSYSSGMAARLGFASAIHTEPDILLIDEVLAVGDIQFRVKCYRKLIQLRKKGVSFILVSHNPHSILGLCNSAVYPLNGKFIVKGESNFIINMYEENLFSRTKEESAGLLLIPAKPFNQSLGLDITSVALKDTEGHYIDSLSSGEPGIICVGCKANQKINNTIFSLIVTEQFGEGESTFIASNLDDDKKLNLSLGEQEIQFMMPYCCLKPGLYSIKLSIAQDYAYNILDALENFSFRVKSSKNMSSCQLYQPRMWQILAN